MAAAFGSPSGSGASEPPKRTSKRWLAASRCSTSLGIFGLKPTIRINHVVITDQPTHVAVASKMIYASHYFWTALELRVLVPDSARGPGFWFASVNRSRSDGLTGFVGRLIRGKVRSEAEKGMVAALTTTKRRLERPEK